MPIIYKIKFTKTKFYRKLRNADQFDGGDNTPKYPGLSSGT